MENELRLEVKRQLFHLILGTAISLLVWILKPMIGNLILIPLFIAIILLFTLPKIAPKSIMSNHLLTHFERKKDLKSFPYKGAIFYGIGIIFPIILLPVELACVVILILSVGDAMSTLIGKFHGKIRIGEKSLEGTMSFILFSFIACVIFLKMAGQIELAKKTLGLVIAGSLIELQHKVDDNLAVPVILSIIARLLY